MRLLTDQDVYAVTVRFLRALGHDVATAAEEGISKSPDADLLRSAQAAGRVFVTRDRDFGGLVFVEAFEAVCCTFGRCPRRCKRSTPN